MANAPKRPRTKSGKPKVETPKRKRVRKPVDMPADPYEAYKVDYHGTPSPIQFEWANASCNHWGESKPDKRLADSVILVALGIVSGAIATAACFLIFA